MNGEVFGKKVNKNMKMINRNFDVPIFSKYTQYTCQVLHK